MLARHDTVGSGVDAKWDGGDKCVGINISSDGKTWAGSELTGTVTWNRVYKQKFGSAPGHCLSEADSFVLADVPVSGWCFRFTCRIRLQRNKNLFFFFFEKLVWSSVKSQSSYFYTMSKVLLSSSFFFFGLSGQKKYVAVKKSPAIETSYLFTSVSMPRP